jgi:peptidoglycan/xylan/chitin deacetylase (PgdA/CDA1 family)
MFGAIKNKPINKSIILAYHRILNPKTDPQLLCTTPQNFEEQLKIISKFYNPISLAELRSAIIEKKIPNKSTVITFDDGYVDNLLFAKPLLEKYKIPATVFITTDYVNKNKEFWWDELERIVLPKNKQQNWDATQELFPNDHCKKYLSLHTKLKNLSFKELEKALEKIKENLVDTSKIRKNYRALTGEEIKDLSKSKYIEIGSHGTTHSKLSGQKIETQIKEIKESKEFLEKIIQKPVTSFSYPFGTREDISQELPELLEKNKYFLATANFPSLITKKTNLFLLPRYLVRNWDGKIFHSHLKRWFNGQ